ncbi:aldehyde dehydrogenase [Nannizzia gypsea CBS 118893]|uniref:aldehyde dehydrogenase (NAD(+)) n=1 Tax=Arthroderma gypseum (strain ATCC MYA-4604 / CBS 118893) TaxID=535722 RepID=E4V1M9_ARTGP|nr:aldehyde dehydrogenase [Nannizzia gypsea CBS 118893]EFR03944.1 aldehyde dehydrogenase [Nannizzia gypsea CBS 118893]
MAAKLDFTTFRNVINGKLTSTAETRHGINPATGEPNAEVPVSTAEDVDAAVAAAQEAFKSWSKTSHEERAKAVVGFADALQAHSQQFLDLIVREQGKPKQVAGFEVQTAVEALRADAQLELKPTVLKDTKEMKVIQRFTPLGVAVGIVPWNFPLMIGALKIAPAVMSGCTVIIKPSPFTPYTNLKAVELAQQFFPPGVIQVLSGDDTLGPMLTEHPGPAKISFTGSTVTGKKVMASASKTLKRVTLELGGNDPAIICEDVDIEKAIPKIAFAAFIHSGQVCVAIKRIFVHESIYEKFRDALVNAVKQFKVGASDEEGVTHGPIQNEMQFNKVKDLFADIEKEKWTVATGGRSDLGRPGYFVEPTIIDRPPIDSRIVTEEPFGPIVPMVAWSDEATVIKDANNTKMGLGASVWSKDLDRAQRIADQLEAGCIWINSHVEPSNDVSFGGHKESGIGYEGGLGGLMGYCNAQSIQITKN